MRSIRIVVFVTVLFSAAVVLAQAPTINPDQIVVTVNGDAVYAAEVQMAAQQLAQTMAASGQQVDPQQIGNIAMQQMVDGRLLVQEAKRRKLTVDPSVIKAAIEQAEGSAGGPEKLDETLVQQGMNRARLDDLIADSDLVRQLLALLGEGVTVSDEEVAAFYKENPKFFETQEEVSASHILIKADQAADEQTKAAAKARAEAARKRALAGEDFATLAKEVSEGPSGPTGGSLGFFSREQMVPQFSAAAFALKPGEISVVVETQFGFHVIKLDERRAPRTVPLEEVQDRIRQGMTQEGQGKKVEELLVGLRETAEIVPVSGK